MLLLLAMALRSSWLLAPTFVLLAHALLAPPLAVAASAPSWQLETFSLRLHLPYSAVVAGPWPDHVLYE